MNPIGIYLHIPFCDGKCPYCDFYSVTASELQKMEYTQALCNEIELWGRKTNAITADTVYFGGGTPILLGAKNLGKILATVQRSFSLKNTAEVTIEANPSAARNEDFSTLFSAGFNRLSFGLQSAHKEELAFLGRRHSVTDVEDAVKRAQAAGFDNISLDLMLGLQNQTVGKVQDSVAYCAHLGAEHVSAYLLKIEEETPFARQTLNLPSEEQQRELYLSACDALEQSGYRQYEISNFSHPGKESRHNLKYWNAEEYLGIGPSAHSFFEGKRFYYPRDLAAFQAGILPTVDGIGGDFEEYVMLRLRLTSGLQNADCQARFGFSISNNMKKAAKILEENGLLCCRDDSITLTKEGFLVSNSVIAYLLNAIEV